MVKIWNYQNNFNNTNYSFKQNTNVDWIQINSMQELENLKIQPNQKIWIMFTNEPIFAVKTADSMGISTTELFKFEKIETPKPPEYITRNDLNIIFEDFKNTISDMLKQSNSLNNKTKKAGENQ